MVASADVVVSAVVVGISVAVVSVAVEAESSTLALPDSVASADASSVDVTLIDNSTEAVVVVTMSVLIVEIATGPVEVADAGSVDTLPNYGLISQSVLY